MDTKIPNCVYDVSPCYSDHPTIKVCQLVAKLISPYGRAETNLKFIKSTTNMGMDSDSNMSMFQQLRIGISDLSAPYMSLVPERVEEFAYPGVLYMEQYMFVYKKTGRAIPIIAPFTLLSLHGIVMILAFAVGWKLANLVVNKYKFGQRVFNRSSIVLGLAIQMLLGYISSNVVLLINQEPTESRPLQSVEDVAQAVYQQKYIPLVYSNLTKKWFFQSEIKGNQQGTFWRFKESTKHSGMPLIVNTQRALRLITNSKSGTPFVYITKTRFLTELLSLSCDLDYFIDYNYNSIKTIYFARGGQFKTLTTAEQIFFSIEKKRYDKILYKPLTCNVPKQDMDNTAKSISINQMMTAQYMLLLMCSASFVVMLAEKLIASFTKFEVLRITASVPARLELQLLEKELQQSIELTKTYGFYSFKDNEASELEQAMLTRIVNLRNKIASHNL